jgi:glucose/arabinose dehydrogenase
MNHAPCRRRRRAHAPVALLAAIAVVGAPVARAAVCDGISDAAASPLTTVRVASGLLRPLLVTAPPGDVERLFIVEQDGTIRILRNGALLPAPFLDVSTLTRSPADGGDNEQGLLGLAFHPDYAVNGELFVYHTDAAGVNNLVVRYVRDPLDPDRADPATRTVLLTIPHPDYGNHNGGMLAFGPGDGRLYIGTGDGGSGCDPSGNAQNPASLLGKLLRLDVDGAFFTPEMVSLGLRNPWRYSFDRQTGDLYIGDVGQAIWEEVDFRPAPLSTGENYGWDFYEGSHCPNPSCGGTCPAIPNLVMPVAEYQHLSGECAVTGGYVYRGCRMTALRGTYFYADYCAAFIHSFRMAGGVPTDPVDHTAELAPGGGLAINQVTSFGEDARGEIYIVDRGGEVFKIVPILPNLEVSGEGAQPFEIGEPSWTWEDLQATSGDPIQGYRVYRSTGNGGGSFDCVFAGSTNDWTGGDAAEPGPGGLFTYVVTALNATGQETSPGSGSDGTPRTLSGHFCPP